MRVSYKLMLLLLLMSLVPLFVAGGFVARGEAERLTESARAYHLAAGEVALTEVRSLLARALAEARSLGALLARPDEPGERREAAAKAALLGAELVDEVAVYGPSGARAFVMRAGTGAKLTQAPPERLDPATRDALAHADFQVSDVGLSDNGGVAMRLILPVYTPPSDADALGAPGSGLPAAGAGARRPIYAYLAVAVSLTPLSQFVAALSGRHFDRPDRVRVLDEHLRVLASSDSGARLRSLAQEPALAEIANNTNPFSKNVAYAVDYEDAAGQQLIGALIPLPELGWGVLVEEEQRVAYAPVAALWRTVNTTAVVAGILALLTAILLGRRMARPVEAIAQAAGQVAGGDFSVRVPISRRDEIGKTADAFNHMAADLATYRDNLIRETKARENLSRFMSPEVVERVIGGAEGLALGGEKREITVLFVDVVGFTDLTRGHEPEAVVAILNELFTIITEIVFQHGGIIDKFIGDCAMALFGAPHRGPEDTQQAVRAAAAILHWLEIGNARWKQKLGQEVELAIGVHAGLAIVGNVGSEKRMEYTAIGDTVNIASRLERLAGPNQILMTRETRERLGDDFDTELVGTTDLMGTGTTRELFALAE